MSDATYRLIKDDFVCELRGVVEIKGKGMMETWYLIDEQARAEGALDTQEVDRI